VDHGILEWLRNEMGDRLMATVRTLSSIPLPPESFEARRNQYYSTMILKQMLGNVPRDALKLLGVTDKDLCIPILTYVFGEAQVGGTAAVVSLARLRQEHYGLAPDRPLLLERLRKESLHELGHTFGLYHCPSRECVMYLSNTVVDVDTRGRDFCTGCQTVVASNTVTERRG
jgi:archaemetzincin